jgi:hypothetical protein
MPFLLGLLKPAGSILLSLLKGYIMRLASQELRLASQEFIEWVIFQLAEAAVKNTKTPHDDVWLAKIKETVKEK